jgi:hypothetical protein
MQLIVCEYCEATNAVDKSRVVLSFAVRQTLRDDEAQAALRRWMAGNDTVKELDRKATIESLTLQLFPVWQVRADVDGAEKVVLEPAAATSIAGVKQLKIPAADLEPFDATLDDIAVEATVPYNAMQSWLQRDYQIAPAQIRETSLVHLPLFIAKYTFQGERYTAVVDAASGQVFASLFPEKWELPYVGLALVAFVLNFLIAFIPLFGYLTGGPAGFIGAMLFYLVAVVVAAIPIFAAATIISARV